MVLLAVLRSVPGGPLVGAGAVVTKDVAPDEVVAGRAGPQPAIFEPFGSPGE